MKVVTIGTRGSALALWQARHVAARLGALSPGLEVRLQVIKTQGDKLLDVPLAQVGGKGLFVKELEDALLRREVDLAVHSIKDVPAQLPAGLELAAIPTREDPRDAIVSSHGGLAALPRGARVGTASLRRRCQLLAARPDLTIELLRGNVDTRLRRLDEGHFDAIVLAAAGLKRLGYGARISECLDPPWLPAIGQGALGIEVRSDDVSMQALLRPLHDEATACCVRAERALLARLGGGCQVPIGGHATLVGAADLRLEALVGHPAGQPVFRGERSGPVSEGEALGRALADELLAAGAATVLAEVYGSGGSSPSA
ncbi:MAG: hydroxymethylbilane synthase [Proteobacteria bacterium]|nr:hydroxymethylbilane synthase [Pseudomonadota bacterium]